MSRTKEEFKDLINEHQADIDRLNRMLLNVHSISSIRFWYWRLNNFEKSSSLHEDLMAMDALTTGIVISYGRLFSSGNGTTKLDSKIIPTSLKSVH